jgi:hypothetical protein
MAIEAIIRSATRRRGLRPGGDHGGGDPAIGSGRLRFERNGVALVLGALKYIQSPGASRGLVVIALLNTMSYLVPQFLC